MSVYEKGMLETHEPYKCSVTIESEMLDSVCTEEMPGL